MIKTALAVIRWWVHYV